MADITPADWNYQTAAHLLLRAGFGHSGRYKKSTGEATQVRRLANLTPEKAVASLLTMGTSKVRGPGSLDTGDDKFATLQLWWLNRMITGLHPLREKMVLFLHTHFATARSKVTKPLYMSTQNALFRELALGDFRELVKRVTVDAAMLWWLDGYLNKNGKPNENYARELQELFTLGVFDFNNQRNYAQKDVTEAARVLTGWRFLEDKGKVVVEFRNTRHDHGEKFIYQSQAGETTQNAANLIHIVTNFTPPENEYAALVDGIFTHLDTEGQPTAARFLARKLWKFFAYDPVVTTDTARTDLGVIDALANVLVTSNYSLGAALNAMFLREEFYADATRTVKGPTEFVVGSVRMLRGKLGGSTRENVGQDLLANMGQELLNPPDVFSWRGNLSWITTQTMLLRYNFASDLAAGDKSRNSDVGHNVSSFLDPHATTRAQVVDRFLTLLCVFDIDTATRNELIQWLGPDDSALDLGNPDYVETQVRGLLSLILTLPLYHVH